MSSVIGEAADWMDAWQILFVRVPSQADNFLREKSQRFTYICMRLTQLVHQVRGRTSSAR